MEKTSIGILHPGAMGISVAVSAQNSGHDVYWVSDGRGPQTRARAERFALREVKDLEQLCRICQAIFCVCPPHAAEEVASQVASLGFRGLYVDANAISPQRAMRIGRITEAAGASFVDGGIIGGPAWEPGRTWLYLSGRDSHRAASCFAAGPLETSIVNEEIGAASALKMCFAAYTKGTTALLGAILAAAESLGVREALACQWSRDGSDFAERTNERVRNVTAKAWRFVGEMEEIAATFEHVGLPGGFHAAAAEIYTRIAHFKGAILAPDAPDRPPLDDLLAALTGNCKLPNSPQI